MRHHVHVTTIPTSEPRPREQVETPERDRARTAGREGSRRDKKLTKEGHHRDDLQGAACPGCEAAGQASAAGASRHEVGDRGEGRRRRKPGNLMPRPRRLQPSTRSTTMAIHALCVSPATSLRAEAGGTAAGTPPRSRARGGCQRLDPSPANECQAQAAERQPKRARQPGGRHGSSSRKRDSKAGSNAPGLPKLGSCRPGFGARRVTP